MGKAAAIVFLAGVLAGCTVGVPGKPMPDAFRDLKHKVEDRELMEGGFEKKSDRWVSGDLHVVVRDGKIVQIGNDTKGFVCDFDGFVTAHLSLVSATMVFGMALEAKDAYPLNKPAVEPIAQRETGKPVLLMRCVRRK